MGITLGGGEKVLGDLIEQLNVYCTVFLPCLLTALAGLTNGSSAYDDFL